MIIHSESREGAGVRFSQESRENKTTTLSPSDAGKISGAMILAPFVRYGNHSAAALCAQCQGSVGLDNTKREERTSVESKSWYYYILCKR